MFELVVLKKYLKNPIHLPPLFSWVFFLIKHNLYFLSLDSQAVHHGRRPVMGTSSKTLMCFCCWRSNDPPRARTCPKFPSCKGDSPSILSLKPSTKRRSWHHGKPSWFRTLRSLHCNEVGLNLPELESERERSVWGLNWHHMWCAEEKSSWWHHQWV